MAKMPDCPLCGDNRAVYEDGERDFYCRTCQQAFGPDDGGDYSSHDPSWRMQREEEREKRKRERAAADRTLPCGFRRVAR